MPRKPAVQPKYRHYKPKNLGVVRIAGRDHYLGEFNTPESWERYHRLIAEWLSASQQSPQTAVEVTPDTRSVPLP